MKSIPKKRRNRKQSNTIAIDSDANLTKRLYAMAVDRYFSSVTNKDEEFKLLSKDDEISLCDQYKNDRPTLEYELTKHNIFLAVNIASHYSYAYSDYDDLLSSAMFGLRVAAKKFDISRGTRFSTCATQWIRKYILHPFYNCSYNKHIRNNTTIFLDSDEFTKDDAYDNNFNYTTFSDKIEPTAAYRYADVKTPVQSIEELEIKDDRLTIISKISDSIASSSLSSDDKKVFSALFIRGKKVSEVANEIGISRIAVVKSKNRITSYISENFSKSRFV